MKLTNMFNQKSPMDGVKSTLSKLFLYKMNDEVHKHSAGCSIHSSSADLQEMKQEMNPDRLRPMKAIEKQTTT